MIGLYMNPRRWFHQPLLIFLAIWLLGSISFDFTPIPAKAQQLTQINMLVEAGFRNVFKGNQWFPVRVLLENNGPNVTGKVTAQFSPASSDTSVFTYPIELASVSRKEIVLYVYPSANYATQIKVSFIETGSRNPVLEQTISLTRLSDTDLLTGVIAANPTSFNIFSLLDPPNGTSRVEELDLEDLPDTVYGLEALDILVLSGVDTGKLNDRQLSALVDWIGWGGHLIVTGGVAWQETMFGLQSLGVLPLVPESSVTIQISDTQKLVETILSFSGSSQPLLDASSSLVLATGNLSTGAEVLLDLFGEEEIPLIVRKDYGKGEVVYLAFDPSLPPFRGWIGAEEMYRRLTNSAWIDSPWGNGFVDLPMAIQAAQTLPSLGLPSMFVICGFLTFYIATIGPANYFLLRYLKRRELGWVTIPILVVCFSILVFLTGNLSRGQKPVSHRLSVVQVWENTRHARVDGVMGIYSPYRATYEIVSKDNSVLHTVSAGLLGQVGETTVIQNGSSFQMPGLRVDVGGVHPVAFQSSIPLPNITNELQLLVQESGTLLDGRITNTSTVNLNNAVLLTNNGVIELGDLGVGKSIDISQLLAAAQSNNQTTVPNVFRSAPGIVPPPLIYTPGNVIEQILGTFDYYKDRELYRKFALLTAVMGYSAGGLQPSETVYLLGWSDQPAVDIDIQGVNENFDDLSLYIFSIKPETSFEGNRWTLSPGFFRWASLDPLRTDISPYNLYLYSPTSYGLVFTPSNPVEFTTVETLIFHLLSPYQNGPVSSATFSLWDFKTSEWVILDDLVWGDNHIEPASRYVAATFGSDKLGAFEPGTIRLNAQINSSYFELKTSDFTLLVSR
jgi:hypothetical protein